MVETFISCMNPENIARRGPSLTTFFMRAEKIQIALQDSYHLPASKTPFKRRFAGGPMMAQH